MYCAKWNRWIKGGDRFSRNFSRKDFGRKSAMSKSIENSTENAFNMLAEEKQPKFGRKIK